MWSVGTGRLLRTLTGHSGSVLCLCLSPDGATLYSGSYDKTIRCGIRHYSFLSPA